MLTGGFMNQADEWKWPDEELKPVHGISIILPEISRQTGTDI